MNILYFNTLFGRIDLLLNRQYTCYECKKQSEILVGGIESILKKNKLKYSDIDYFSTITGPGNFTSIKTNIAIAKAINIASDKKIVVNNLFEVIGFNESGYDYIAIGITPIKYYVKDGNNEIKIMNSIEGLNGKVLTLEEWNNDKWRGITEHKISGGIFESLDALYIENASITMNKK